MAYKSAYNSVEQPVTVVITTTEDGTVISEEVIYNGPIGDYDDNEGNVIYNGPLGDYDGDEKEIPTAASKEKPIAPVKGKNKIFIVGAIIAALFLFK